MAAQRKKILPPWWTVLSAIPEAKDTIAYRRLQRVWTDTSRFTGKKGSLERDHEFVNPRHETHLTASLWENFSLFDPDSWIRSILTAANMPVPVSRILKCNWSYEWASFHRDGGGKRRERMCDVVLEFEIEGGIRHLTIVEAKSLGKTLGAKDTDFAYYLKIPQVAAFDDRVWLIYLVDEKVRGRIETQLGSKPVNAAVLTWQELAGVQITLALQLSVEDPICRFVAGAIQHQFLQHGILPSSLAADYLSSEPSQAAVDLLPGECITHYKELWRLAE